MAVLYVLAAWLMMQVAGVLMDLGGLPATAGPWLLAVLVIGFPIALVFSWFYELTPEGLALEKDVPEGASITHVTGRRMDFIVISLLSAAVLLFAWHTWWPSAPMDRSIAVLPFEDMSERQDQGWFADGLAEEILNTLVRTPDLMVSSRTSSFAYRDTQTPITQIANDLRVGYVLEGSVRRTEDRVRVTTQLIRAADGFHVWSENFDRSVEDVIKIQEDIAYKVAKALETTMDPDALKKMSAAGTHSVEAYDHYMRGLASLGGYLEASNPNLKVDALDHFDRAREVDPSFSAAHAQSALIWRITYAQLRGGAFSDFTPQQGYAKFRQAMIAAIESAPDETQRLLYEAMLANDELRNTEAVRLLRRVLEKWPNSYVATAELQYAAVRSLDSEAFNFAMNNLLRLGDIVAVHRYLTEVFWFMPSDHHTANVMEQIKRFPNSKEIIYQAHKALLWAGELEEAHKLYPRLGATRNPYMLAAARQGCSLGKRDEVEQILTWGQQQGWRGTSQWHLLVLLGEHEAVVQALKPFDSVEVPMLLGSFLSYPQFDPKPFPALMSLLEREGLDWPPPRRIPFACPPKNTE
jgi:TolB-like protein